MQVFMFKLISFTFLDSEKDSEKPDGTTNIIKKDDPSIDHI